MNQKFYNLVIHVKKLTMAIILILTSVGLSSVTTYADELGDLPPTYRCSDSQYGMEGYGARYRDGDTQTIGFNTYGPFSLSDGSRTSSQLYFLDLGGNLISNGITFNVADTHYQASHFWDYHEAWLKWGTTNDTVCIKWYYNFAVNWGNGSSRVTTLKLLRLSDGRILGKIEGNDRLVYVPQINGVPIETDFVIDQGIVRPYILASPPAITQVLAENGVAHVDFLQSTEAENQLVTNYEFSTDGGLSWTPASPAQTTSPLAISGLSNGNTYGIKLRAVNGSGPGAVSNGVSIKPVAPASAPSISGITAGNGQATLSISAPAQINDSSLSGYDYSINNGSTWSHFASVTGPFTITGLTNATAYQVKVRAVNSAGVGEASTAVTVNPTRLVPAKPVIGSVVGGNGSATVNITTPKDVTAQSITGYQYSIDRGATYQNAAVSNGSFTVTGLTNGVSTAVLIRATNFNGSSLASLAKTVIPATSPAAPSITTVTPSAGALSIAFTAGATGGRAITGYQYSLDGGSTWVVPKTAIKTSPLRVTGLANATAYLVKIRAVNAKGAGLASDAVSASTPVLVP